VLDEIAARAGIAPADKNEESVAAIEQAEEADAPAAERETSQWRDAALDTESASPSAGPEGTAEEPHPEEQPEPTMAAEEAGEAEAAAPVSSGPEEEERTPEPAAIRDAQGAPETVVVDAPETPPAPAPAVGAAGIPERDPPGTAELADIVASNAVRVALFVGAEGGEGTGEIAYATARQVVRKGERSVVVDLGARPSPLLSPPGEPGLADLLAGEFSFGEVIRRDEPSNVHVISTGKVQPGAPFQRLQLVIGALTHTYDKVIVVADSVADWPAENLKPDLAAIVCGPATTEASGETIYETALERGARSAIIVRYASDGDGQEASEAA
jgi:Mrp family chromosome partitioning ATPase